MKLNYWHYAIIGAVVLLAAWWFQSKHDSCGYCQNRWVDLTGARPGSGAGVGTRDASGDVYDNA